MDHEEEKANELEALESIFMDEFEAIDKSIEEDDDENITHSFLITIKPAQGGSNEEDAALLSTKWKISLSKLYPEEPAQCLIISSENVDEGTLDSLTELCETTAAESLGFPACFNIITAIQDKLTESYDYIVETIKFERERKLREEEDALKRKLIGTAVTMDSFLKWRERFIAEMDSYRAEEIAAQEALPKKLTGKEMFQQGHDYATEDDDLFFEGVDDLDIDDIPLDDFDGEEGEINV